MGGKRVEPPATPELDNPQPHGQMILRVMSYNIHALPIFGGADESLMRDIGKALKARRDKGEGPDIVLIQEGFHANVDYLLETAKFPYKKFGPPANFPRSNSGLIMLSDYPIVSSEVHPFALENSAGMDWNAEKGILWTQVRLPHAIDFLDVMNTHMQADYTNDIMAPPEETIAARERQELELKNFFWKKVKPNAPVIFGGDFNSTSVMEDYYNIIAYTFLYNAAEYCALFENCTTNVNPYNYMKISVDHQFFRPNGTLKVEPIVYKKSFDKPVNGRMLSDHAALEVHYKITW